MADIAFAVVAITAGVSFFIGILLVTRLANLSSPTKGGGGNVDKLATYCALCGGKMFCRWEVCRYDTNTGKPKIYRGINYCDKCKHETREYQELDAYQWERRHASEPVDYFEGAE